MRDNLTLNAGLEAMMTEEMLTFNGGFNTWFWYLGDGDGPISSDELARLAHPEPKPKKTKTPERFRY